MTETLLVIAFLAQNAETPPVPAEAAGEKAAEPAPAPAPAPAAVPKPVAPPELAAKPIPARARPQIREPRSTSEPGFAATGVTEGLLLMPYWGINSALGAAGYSVGQRMGLFVGWNVNNYFLFNAELAMDVLDANSLSFPSKPSDKLAAIAASPLLRVYSSHAMWLFGPSLGYFARDLWTYWAGSNGSMTSHVASRGFMVALSVGAFVPVGRVALGGLANLRIYFPTRTCTTTSTDNWGFVGEPEDCDSEANGDDTKFVVGLAGAVLF